jgi:hypothetical protein
MEILYFIVGLIAVYFIWGLVSSFLDKKKENNRKLKEFPLLKEQLAKEKLLSLEYKDKHKFETLRVTKILQKLAEEIERNDHLQKVNDGKTQNLLDLEIKLQNTQQELTVKFLFEKSEKENLQNYYNNEVSKVKEISLEILTAKEEQLKLKDLNKFQTDTIEKLTSFLANSNDELTKYKSQNEQLGIELAEEIKTKDDLKLIIDDLEQKNTSEKQNLNRLERERDNLKNGIEEQHELFVSIQNKSEKSVSKITSMYSDFLLLEYDVIARRLENKTRPAITEGKRIRELKAQSKFHLEQYRQMLYKYEYLLNVFPELTNYVDDFDTLKQLDDANTIDDFKEDFDNVQNYLSKEEYFDLDEDFRNQLALDRYLKGNKTSWQVGRDYEMSCGLTYEEKGWDVEYFGMEKRLKDLGRDLIARKGDNVEIIQCKLWKKTKTIHEKHILQLYGTTIIETMINPDLFKIVVPVFITNTSLSETATKFANILGVRIEKLEMKEFPRIKCNRGFDENGVETKIYHLPFDQHYDRTKIKLDQGFFAKNISEATEQGFRRSYKYYGR